MSPTHLAWLLTGSTLSPMILQLRFSNSGCSPAIYPSSVVQTGVKSFGWENRIAQPLPTHSWKSIVPRVVSAVKFRASELILNDMTVLLVVLIAEWARSRADRLPPPDRNLFIHCSACRSHSAASQGRRSGQHMLSGIALRMELLVMLSAGAKAAPICRGIPAHWTRPQCVWPESRVPRRAVACPERRTTVCACSPGLPACKSFVYFGHNVARLPVVGG